jgi:hypothetical protein
MRFHIHDDGQRLEVRLLLKRSLAFTRIVRMLRRWQRKRERIPGLHAGAYQVRDDFDEPLPEDFLITGP